MLTLLSHLFVTERYRRRAANVGHSMPLASEVDINDRSIEPLMITSTRGTFLESRVARGGYVRFGFSECGLDQEAGLIQEFHRVLISCAKMNGWSCVSNTVNGALSLMRGNGVRPGHIAAGPWLSDLEFDGVKVLDAGFPQGSALLVAEPSSAGLHTRVGDYVGVLAYKVNLTFVAIIP